MESAGPSDPDPVPEVSGTPSPPPAASQRPAPPPGAYAGPPYAPYGPPPSRSPAAGWWVAAVLAVLVVGVGGYLLGHQVGASNERDDFDAGAPGYNDIYQQGFAAGQEKGTQQGQAKGAAAGQQAGLEQGKQQGEAQGSAAGAEAALGGFTSWDAGAPYVVKVQTATGDVPYEISSRTQMEPDTEYALCQDDPTQVCTVARTTTGGTCGP